MPGADEVEIMRRWESNKIYGEEDWPLTWRGHHISSYDYISLYMDRKTSILQKATITLGLFVIAAEYCILY